jgi:2-amino-4-hydroxy-6-hydroxymethyldihydropteridine diphosphokinase
MRYHIGLGSNLGDRARQLALARTLILRCVGPVRRSSSLYATEPVGFSGQRWFLNQVLEVESALSPWQVLSAAKAMERRMKRAPGPRNGPRRIDIDVLLAEDTILRTEGLTIPHPRLAERRFVLVPLAEIAPRKRHPVLRRTIAALRRACPDRSRVIRLPETRGDSHRELMDDPEALKTRFSSVQPGPSRRLRPRRI